MKRVAVVAAVALLAVAGCGGSAEPSSESGQPDDVKVGLISILDVAPIYLGQDKGFFEKRNINLTLQPAEGGTETVPSVLSGNQQFGFSNVTTLLLAQAQGLPVTVVSNGVNSVGVDGKDFGALMVSGNSPVKSVADLKGKKVAVNTFQNVVELAVRASAQKADVDPNSIEFVKLGFPEMPAALSEGRADAVFVVEPFQQIVLSQGGRSIASGFVDIAPNLCVATRRSPRTSSRTSCCPSGPRRSTRTRWRRPPPSPRRRRSCRTNRTSTTCCRSRPVDGLVGRQ